VQLLQTGKDFEIDRLPLWGQDRIDRRRNKGGVAVGMKKRISLQKRCQSKIVVELNLSISENASRSMLQVSFFTE
jgi:hypothetical protein